MFTLQISSFRTWCRGLLEYYNNSSEVLKNICFFTILFIVPSDHEPRGSRVLRFFFTLIASVYCCSRKFVDILSATVLYLYGYVSFFYLLFHCSSRWALILIPKKHPKIIQKQKKNPLLFFVILNIFCNHYV